MVSNLAHFCSAMCQTKKRLSQLSLQFQISFPACRLLSECKHVCRAAWGTGDEADVSPHPQP